MWSEPKTSNPEIQTSEKSSINSGVSRETIAQKLWLKVEDVPTMASYEKIQGMLGELEDEVKEKKWEARVTLLKQRLNEISLKEAADKASEVADDVAKKAKEMAPQVLNSAVKDAQNVLKQTGVEGMKWALQAVSDMANSGWDLNKISKWVDGLTKAVDTTSKGVSGVFESLGWAIKWLLEALGVMGLFRSIGRFFGMDSSEKSEDKASPVDKIWGILWKPQDSTNPEKLRSNILECFYTIWLDTRPKDSKRKIYSDLRRIRKKRA